MTLTLTPMHRPSTVPAVQAAARARPVPVPHGACASRPLDSPRGCTSGRRRRSRIRAHAPTVEAAGRVAGTVVVASLEILAGQREVDQLARWSSRALLAALARRAHAQARDGHRTPCSAHRFRVHSIHPQLLRPGVCHASVVVEDMAGDSQRIRAAAVRLEYRHQRWVLVSLDIL